ncbi:MAG: chorismate mutase [Treponema sp.]|jgi:chorismate mutase|nr:chorismate mutase [Treponema sp.]
MGEKRLKALRGATQCENEGDDITQQVTMLYDELLVRNQLNEADIVSLVFSLTRDLDAKNPASALRHSGRAQDLALFTVQEAYIAGGLERTIRVLIHAYLDGAACHVYRNGAEILRPDRSALTRGG